MYLVLIISKSGGYYMSLPVDQISTYNSTVQGPPLLSRWAFVLVFLLVLTLLSLLVFPPLVLDISLISRCLFLCRAQILDVMQRWDEFFGDPAAQPIGGMVSPRGDEVGNVRAFGGSLEDALDQM